MQFLPLNDGQGHVLECPLEAFSDLSRKYGGAMVRPKWFTATIDTSFLISARRAVLFANASRSESWNWAWIGRAAMGLLIAWAAVLLVLPPVLAVGGRRIFWPFVPRPGVIREQGRAWRAMASRVVKRPVTSLVGGLALLAMMAAGLFGTSIGLDQVEKFR